MDDNFSILQMLRWNSMSNGQPALRQTHSHTHNQFTWNPISDFFFCFAQLFAIVSKMKKSIRTFPYRFSFRINFFKSIQFSGSAYKFVQIKFGNQHAHSFNYCNTHIQSCYFNLQLHFKSISIPIWTTSLFALTHRTQCDTKRMYCPCV